MKKILLSGLILLSSSTSFANSEDNLNLDLFDHKILEFITESNEYPSLRGNIFAEDLNDVLKSISKISKMDPSKEMTDKLSFFTEEIIKKQNPKLHNYWDEQVSTKGILINQANSIFDLERIKYSKPEYATKEIGDTGYSIYEQQNPIFTNEIPSTSRHRMMKGMPGIGPDGKDIVICRLLHSSHAPYYEMAYTDAERLLKKMDSDMSFSQSCIFSTKHMARYWQYRVEDFNPRNRY